MNERSLKFFQIQQWTKQLSMFVFLWQYLESSFALLFQLLQQVSECDTKVRRIYLWSRYVDGHSKLPCLLLVIFFVCLLVFTKLLSHFCYRLLNTIFLLMCVFLSWFSFCLYIYLLNFFRSILELLLTRLVLFFNMPLAMFLLQLYS